MEGGVYKGVSHWLLKGAEEDDDKIYLLVLNMEVIGDLDDTCSGMMVIES